MTTIMIKKVINEKWLIVVENGEWRSFNDDERHANAPQTFFFFCRRTSQSARSKDFRFLV